MKAINASFKKSPLVHGDQNTSCGEDFHPKFYRTFGMLFLLNSEGTLHCFIEDLLHYRFPRYAIQKEI